MCMKMHLKPFSGALPKPQTLFWTTSKRVRRWEDPWAQWARNRAAGIEAAAPHSEEREEAGLGLQGFGFP